MCCGTARRKNRRLVGKMSVSGYGDRLNPPRNRRRSIRLLASLARTVATFCSNRLHHSLNKPYIYMCSNSWDLGGCSHVVTGCRSGAMSKSRPNHDASLTRRALTIKKNASKTCHSKSRTTGKHLASQNMSRKRKRWPQYYFIANILRHGCPSKFVILSIGVRPIMIN